MKDFKEVLQKHANELSPPEMLALASQLVGNLVALQDQQEMSIGSAMNIVRKNIEVGNRMAIFNLMTTVGNG